MKNHLNAHVTTRHFLKLAFAASLAFPIYSLAAPVILATSPLATSSTSSVMPNVMFMLDDSGSMDWDYMPDDSKNFSGFYGFETNHCNGVYYNPAITYTPPVKSDGTSYPNSSFSAAWKSGYNTAAGTVNLNTGFTGGSGTGSSGINMSPGPAFYYTYSGTQTAGWQMDFHNTSSIFYKECVSPVGSTTKVDGTNPVNTVFTPVRLAITPTTTLTVTNPAGGATITVSGSGSTSTKVSSITVSGKQILSAATSGSTTKSTVVQRIVDNINACTTAITGSCQVSGFSATCAGYPTCTGSIATIYGNGTSGGLTPSVTSTGSLTLTPTAFPPNVSTAVTSITVNGTQLLLSGSTAASTSINTLAAYIAAGINATGYSATVSANVVTVTGPTSASNLTPVITTSPATGGLTVSTAAFPESTPAYLQNFANWYSYYSTRMLMMKTGVGQAFSPITNNFRVGFMTMNNNVSPDIVNIDTFAGGCAVGSGTCQKDKWYTKLYASTPGNSTPLREALSHVGQLYAHKFGTYNTYTATITVTTPSGYGPTGVSGITMDGTQIMAGPAQPASTASALAAAINNQINIMDPSDYGSTVSGNVITITGPASAYDGNMPLISDDGGGMTLNATAFQQNTISASLNGILPSDPVQYSCQQNFVILSTDGYWNGSTTYDLSTPTQTVGNQDGSAPRPMYDGSAFKLVTSETYQIQKQMTQTTSQLQSKTTQLQSSTSNLQSSTYALQSTAYPLQSSTAALQKSIYPLQSSTATLNQQAYQLQYQTTHLQTRTRASSGASWSSWSNVGTCTWATSYPKTSCQYSGVNVSWTNGPCTINDQSANTSNGNTWTGDQKSCQYVTGSLTTVSSCSPVAKTTSTTDQTVWNASAATCTYGTATTPATVGSCTYQDQSGPPYVGPSVTCSYGTPAVTTVASCTPVAKTTSTTNGTAWTPSATTCTYGTATTPATVGSCTYQDQSGPPYVGPSVTCSYGTPTVTTVTSCTPVAKTTSTTNGTAWDPTAHTCAYSTTPVVANVGSCTAVAQSTSSPYAGPAVSCGYTAWSAYANAGSCTAVAQSTASPYTVATATQCQQLCNGQTEATPFTCTNWVGAASCSNSGPTNGKTVYCPNPNPVVTGPTPVTSCTTQTASSSNNYLAISCTPIYGSGGSTGIPVASCTPVLAGASNNYTATTCNTVQLSSNNNASSCTPGQSTTSPYITTTCSIGSGGTSDTLADVAMYYYQTDLRDSSLANCNGASSTDFPSGNPDVCTDNVFISGTDNNVKQHLTTFTLGLGARGRMAYTSKDYMNDTSGDFYSVKTGATTNLTSSPPVCSWQTAGTTCNWPIPSSGNIANIDDLWHAAVNGRGTYFSATDPASLSDGLSSALSSITARKGAAAAAATSTLNPVSGNNFAYVASYTTVKWIGNLEARTINTTTGVVDKNATWCVENLTADTCVAPSYQVVDTSGSSNVYNCVTPNSTAASCIYPNVFDSVANTCSVQMALSCNGTMPSLVGPTSDTRNIYTSNSSGSSLINFDATYAANNPANFSVAHINSLSQWPALTAAQQTAAAGVNLLNYLRGQYGYDDRATNPVANQLYRYREATLGDALESQPSYIGAPTFSYADAGYSAFVTSNQSRAGTVYMGTNDGMLHAFNAVNGVERWAYIPSMVIPNLYKLADENYSTQHVNYVNGSPVISDFYCSSNCKGSTGAAPSWRTIVVGGLNGGGRSYYALDITDPTAPILLWEFTPTQNANLGYSYGLPIITKMANGTWVVIVTSGYDNGSLSSDGVTANSPAGNGQGYLYVLDAETGVIIKSISTGVGSPTTPSGLAKVAAWNSDPASNQAGYIYGGDLLGNVWRFDINAATGTSPMLFATLKDASGNAQPVTTTPTLGLILNKTVVFVGTGEYLAISDLTNTKVQSLYAIKDDNATATLVNPRSYSSTAPLMVQQTITANGSVRTGSNNPVDFSVDRGWFVDFPDSGERVNIDSKLVQGALLVPTIVPSSTACSPGGYGWLNFFDYTTGQPITDGTGVGTAGTNTNVSTKYDATIVGMNILFIAGKPIVEIITSDNPTPTVDQTVVIKPSTSNFTGMRMQWRELIP